MTVQADGKLSRRDFLRTAGTGVSVITVASLLAEPVEANEAPATSPWGVLIDLTRCTGCESCVLACKESNNLANPEIVATSLDSDAYSCLETHSLGNGAVSYVKRQCMHCLHPACASACTVGALTKTAAGPVVYDSAKCIGCRYCQYACPFGVPAFEWENPLGLISKCQFCQTQLGQGQTPACAAACPNGALRFGRREELLAQAKAQIETNPGRYVDHIYGEYEAGGTSMLYLAGVPFVDLGFPELGSEPIPHQAETVMNQTPAIALTVASLASALAWFLQRRKKLALVPVETEESR